HPDHERRAGERAAARGLAVSLSSDILPEYREYERASTTVANAYVAPVVSRYLARLGEAVAGRAAAGGEQRGGMGAWENGRMGAPDRIAQSPIPPRSHSVP